MTDPLSLSFSLGQWGRKSCDLRGVCGRQRQARAWAPAGARLLQAVRLRKQGGMACAAGSPAPAQRTRRRWAREGVRQRSGPGRGHLPCPPSEPAHLTNPPSASVIFLAASPECGKQRQEEGVTPFKKYFCVRLPWVLVAAHHDIFHFPFGIQTLSCRTWDLGSPPRDPTHPTCSGVQSLNHRPTGKSHAGQMCRGTRCAPALGGRQRIRFLPPPSRCEAGALRTLGEVGSTPAVHLQGPFPLLVGHPPLLCGEELLPRPLGPRRTLGMACMLLGSQLPSPLPG